MLCIYIFVHKFQDPQIYIDVRPDHDYAELNNLPEEIEKKKLLDLERELDTVKGDVMLLYTEFTAQVRAIYLLTLRAMVVILVLLRICSSKIPLRSEFQSIAH